MNDQPASVALPHAGIRRRRDTAADHGRSLRRGIADRCRSIGDVVCGRRRPLPAFIIAGAMRCGTTSLHAALAGHPRLAASRRKEVHYFDLQHHLGVGWYARQFQNVRRSSDGTLERPFESSPYYMFDPRVPARLKETLPDVRILFVLRDPVERAISHYRKNRRDGREPLSFADAIDAEEERLAGEEERMLADPRYLSQVHQYASYQARGRYAELIERFRRHFPDDQWMAVDAGRLFAEGGRVVEEICRFVGIEPWRPDHFAAENSSRVDVAIDEAARRKLEAAFEPHERALVDLVGWRPSACSVGPPTPEPFRSSRPTASPPPRARRSRPMEPG